MAPGVIRKKGYLTKQGHIIKNWKRRFFVLDETHLYYYVDEEEYKADKAPKGVLELARCYVCPEALTYSGRPHVFEVKQSNPNNPAKYKPYFIAGESASETEGWLASLRKGSLRIAPTQLDEDDKEEEAGDNGVCEQCRCRLGNDAVRAHGRAWHAKCMICAGCKKQIFSNPDKTTCLIKGQLWHKGCVKCSACSKILDPAVCASVKGKLFCGDCQMEARRVKASDVSQKACEKCCRIMGVLPRAEIDGKFWHASCWACMACGKKLDTNAYWSHNRQYLCAGCYESASGDTVHCATCSLTLVPGVKFVTLKGTPGTDGKKNGKGSIPLRKYHPHCFKCNSCNKGLDSSKPFFVRGLMVVCQTCRDK